MTAEQCDVCKYSSWVSGYPDGQNMFTCDCNDPKLPFNMEEDTFCPCFELDDSKKIDDYGDSYCPYCGCHLDVIEDVYSSIGQDGYSFFEDDLECENCGRRFHREYSQHIVIDDCEIKEIKEEKE